MFAWKFFLCVTFLYCLISLEVLSALKMKKFLIIGHNKFLCSITIDENIFNDKIIPIYGNRDFTYQSLESAMVSHIERTTKSIRCV